MTKKRFQIQGMHCVGCAMTIDNALEDLAGVRVATTQYARQIVDIDYDEQQVTDEKIIAAIEGAGYRASALSAERN
ncbi:MAG: heavy-metal-associated domain-containing protein [Anaerolineae bacterium]|nr:heavy-metal-associated domain-containing protein [Anaerolineae bacterium]